MADDLASPTLLAHLQALYPSSAPTFDVDANPWYIAAAIAFSAANKPQAVPLVFAHALGQIPAGDHAARLRLARKMRDALFKSGLICGYPKAINGLVALYEATPEELRDAKPLRNVEEPKEKWTERGTAFFADTYGETAQTTTELLTNISPDFAYFCLGPAYGFVYSFEEVLSKPETSYVMIAGLVAIDTPRQIVWHLKGAVRNGASRAQVSGIRAIAMEVAQKCGVSWAGEVPDVE